MKVYTAIGLLERDALTVKDIVKENEHGRQIATEWYLGEELVRRDGWFNKFVGFEAGDVGQ